VLLQRETTPELNTVTAYGEDYLEINKVKYTKPVYFTPNSEIKLLDFDTVQKIDARQLRMLTGVQAREQSPLDFLNGEGPQLDNPDNTEILLLGTGQIQTFLHPEITAELQGIGIGVEIMTTPAAARTYNILMSEGRLVVAALMI